MNEQQTHTPEPWNQIDPQSIIVMSNGEGRVAIVDGANTPEKDAANAQRIVACVNFLKGVPTELLMRMNASEFTIKDVIEEFISLANDYEAVNIDDIFGCDLTRSLGIDLSCDDDEDDGQDKLRKQAIVTLWETGGFDIEASSDDTDFDSYMNWWDAVMKLVTDEEIATAMGHIDEMDNFHQQDHLQSVFAVWAERLENADDTWSDDFFGDQDPIGDSTPDHDDYES